jgi:sarcosine oxidase delta subunit
VHLTCGEFFAMSRDSVDHKVSGSSLLGEAEHGR